MHCGNGNIQYFESGWHILCTLCGTFTFCDIEYIVPCPYIFLSFYFRTSSFSRCAVFLELHLHYHQLASLLRLAIVFVCRCVCRCVGGGVTVQCTQYNLLRARLSVCVLVTCAWHRLRIVCSRQLTFSVVLQLFVLQPNDSEDATSILCKRRQTFATIEQIAVRKCALIQ